VEASDDCTRAQVALNKTPSSQEAKDAYDHAWAVREFVRAGGGRYLTLVEAMRAWDAATPPPPSADAIAAAVAAARALDGAAAARAVVAAHRAVMVATGALDGADGHRAVAFATAQRIEIAAATPATAIPWPMWPNGLNAGHRSPGSGGGWYGAHDAPVYSPTGRRRAPVTMPR